MRIQARRHGYYLDGNYYPTWLALIIISAYSVYVVIKSLIKGSVWLCKRLYSLRKSSRTHSVTPYPQPLRDDYRTN